MNLRKKIVVVGGVAGGASAAARLRRLDESADIVLLEQGQAVSFANCGLPYHLGGVIEQRSSLVLQTPESLGRRFHLDVRVFCKALSINRSTREIKVKNLKTGQDFLLPYDNLILATGAEAVKPPISGIDLEQVSCLQNLDDLDKIKSLIESAQRYGREKNDCPSAVVLGAGFIGIEVCENLRRKGFSVTLLERGNQVFPPLDPEMAFCVEQELLSQSVTLMKQVEVKEILPLPPGRVAVKLADNKVLEAHLVVVAAGVKPRSQLAVDCGLAVSARGAVEVNAHMQTSDPAIYAVGDLVECVFSQLQKKFFVPLAGPANRQGRIAAGHICGQKDARFKGAWGTAVCGVFEKTVASTGLSEKLLRSLHMNDIQVIFVHPGSHAGYYPGAEPMTIKMIYDGKSGCILGAQAFGGEGVDKRIDVLATAIQAGMTVFDLEDLELCYAPAYGSAKDPVNMLGFVASNQMKGLHELHDAWSLLSAFGPQGKSLGLWLDVRSPGEYSNGHIPGARNIPLDDLRQRLGELPKDKTIITYCQVGFRGYLAHRILAQMGYQSINVTGGYKAYLLYQGAQLSQGLR